MLIIIFISILLLLSTIGYFFLKNQIVINNKLRIKIKKLSQELDQDLNLFTLHKGIHLTKKEKSFLKLLLQNKNKILTYEMIEYSVYKEKIMSMDSLRSLVRRIRMKLLEDVIANIVDEGYMLKL